MDSACIMSFNKKRNNFTYHGQYIFLHSITSDDNHNVGSLQGGER